MFVLVTIKTTNPVFRTDNGFYRLYLEYMHIKNSVFCLEKMCSIRSFLIERLFKHKEGYLTAANLSFFLNTLLACKDYQINILVPVIDTGER